MSRPSIPLTVALAAFLTLRAIATPVINEIMYHSAAVPEDHTQEWIEIYNDSAASTFDLSGWQFTNGVGFTFPNGTSLLPGGYLVVAANVASFQAAHPGFAGQLVGGWTGGLANSGEHLVLSDATGATVDEVHYSNEGEWGTRGRGPLVLSHRGWEWFSDADGGGKTLELRNPALASFDCGQNWGVSTVVGGTPGAANSVASANIAPLIQDVKHKPDVPHSTDPIVVSCNLHDEGPNAVATLFWRLDGTTPFNALPMSDTDGDGDVEATIPAQANLAIVEYYISAIDGTNARTWPAPARTSDIGVLPETYAQVTNALVLVDNSFDPNALFQAAGSQPIYRLIMTAAEKAELLQIQTNSAQDLSDAAMNATFISQDGTGVEVRYLAAIRNRGTGSRLGPPNNYHVGFRNDDIWQDRGSLQINCRYPHSQVLGALCFDLAGIAPQESAVVRIRVNGVDLAETGLRMYGRYVRNETMSSEWAKRHYPNDPDGNIYFLDDHNAGPVGTPPGNLGSGEFRYEGTNPLAYSDTYFKKTNEEINDYSDLITLTDKLNNTPDASFVATIQQYLDLDQFYTFIATDALIGNQEGGLQSGRADDVGLYRGNVDTRFRLIPHDFDSVFALGLNGQDPGGPGGGGGFGDPTVRSIFSYDGEQPTSGADGVLGLHKLFSHPALVPVYYSKVLDQMNNWFNHATLDPIIDRVLGGWVAATGANVSVASVKAFIDTRRANVLAQIQQNYAFTAAGNAADVNGMKQTTDGSATFSGTFNVAKTYSITVNGTPATMFQRINGANAAGTWNLVVGAGSGFLKPGINRVTANFYDGLNGTGNVLTTLTVDVYDSGGTQIGIAANGVPQVDSVGLIAPDSYVPGVPVMVRVDLRDPVGNYDRTAWNTTATLTATNGVALTPNTVTLYNGVGSALVSAGSGSGGTAQTIFSYGTGGTGTTTVSGMGGSVWKTKTDFTTTTLASFITASGTTWMNEGFDDSTWITRTTQTGYGDGDENQTFAEVDYDSGTAGTQAAPSYLFRNTFTIADMNALASVTGEIKYDDGAIVYVNGTQILRTSNLDPAGNLASYANYLGAAATENATSALSVPLNLLHNGVNTIAVEVHQQANTSSDVTFDLKLQANFPAVDPGNFTLTATAGGLSSSKVMISLNGVTPTSVSGTLAGSNTWSGVVHVTGDVTIPAGATLTIQPGTHVLVDGTATAGDTTGKRIIVNGTLNAPGLLVSPISVTSFDPSTRWGGFVYSSAQPSTLNFCLISHAAHTATLGHTNKGPIFNITSSNVTLQDCVWGESPGKAMITTNTCDIVIQRSLITHTITGPELQDGASLLCQDTNIQEILPVYRESNDPVPDDEDCLYIHNAPGRSILVNRCVFAKCGDDTMDNLAGPLTVQDSILRQAWDKGVSLLDNDLTIVRTQIIDCDKGVALKGRDSSTRTVTMDHCTVSSEEHDTTTAPWGYSVPPALGDPDAPATGIWTQNKAGQSSTSAVLIFNVSNSILEGKIPINVEAPYPAANTMATYTCTHDTDTAGATAWPGTGNIEAMPLFVDGTNKDFHLQTTSPCKNTGNPAAPLDADGSRTDMGALPFGGTAIVAPTDIVWAAANSPFHVTANVTIPTGTTLTIESGVTVYTNENQHILINGSVRVVGDANHHITLSGVPGLPLKADPADPGLPLTTPKWGGFWLENSNDPNNLISYVDFVDAQDNLAASIAVNRGCIELKESACTVDHCTFRGTHLHMIYGDHCSITCQYCNFPDEFPGTDLPGALNNVAEPFKLTNKFLPGGHCIVQWNVFHGNKGHNDVLDVDSDVLPNPILQLRENLFLGQSGDEDADLGGDVLIDGNVFSHGHKDTANTSFGHASAFSTGDAGTGTTVSCTRNIFWDVDHATTLKTGTGTIFEYNTNYALHPNFTDVNNNVDVAAAVSLLVPAEGTPPADGAYCGANIFWVMPRVFGDADKGTNGVGTFPTRLQFDLNVVDPTTPTAVGTLHPGGLYSLGTGNIIADPKLVDPANGNFALADDSPARGAGVFGNDLGALVPAGAMITGEPPAQTPSTSVTLTVGGPGVFYYKWQLDGGAWSAPIAIDPANPLKFPRTGPTHRTAQLALSGLANGPHTVSVVGQDFGGQWQDTAAATVSKTWTVNTTLQLVQINEVLAESATLPDTIELYNAGANTVNLGGWSLSDDPQTPNKYVIPANTMLPAGGYYTVTSTTSLINLDKDGDSVYLHNGATLVDSVTFGHQVPDLSIGRIGQAGVWALCQPTLGAANVRQPLGSTNTVRINEWFTSGDVLYDNDWIELANTGPLPVSLSGLKLTDNPAGNPSVAVLPPLSFIAANGFVKLIADGHPELGATHLNFSLDAQQEEIALLTAIGTQLDHVIFYPQTTDYSQGRDASGNYVYYELPTAGFANGTGDPAYANALALLHGLRITEIMYNAIGGDLFDYIVLRNVGATPLQLAGVKFVEGIDFTFPTMTLAPGQNVVVCKDVTKFRARYGNGPNVAGAYTGKLDNGGETLGLQLPPPFDANILTFSYSDGWYSSTDGFGTSLVVFDPLVKANVWGDRNTWRASSQNGGNPDGFTARTDTYSGWSAVHAVLSVTADDDKDGVPALVEYALGMDPADPNDGDGPAGAPFVTVNASGHAQLHFLVPATAAPQGHGMAEAVYNVQASSDLATWTTIATKTFTTSWTGTVSVGAASGGFVPVIAEDTVAGQRRYLRLQVVWAP